MRRNLRARSPSESLSNPPKSKPPEKPLPAPLKTQSRVPSLAATPSASIKASTKPSLRSEEHTSELQSRGHLVCRLLLEKKKKCHRERREITYDKECNTTSTKR